ncbi:MAG TPA: NADH-quinone oxidoreductase subunit N [Leptolinea sp.]
MGTPMDNIEQMITLLPEIILIGLSLAILFLDLIWKKPRKTTFGWVTVIGLVAAAVTSLMVISPQNDGLVAWGDMLRFDMAATVFRLLFLVGAAITALFSVEDENLNRRGEFYFLLVISTLGLSMLAAAADLIMVFLALETASIPLYMLAGFFFRDGKSVESGLKYLLYGAMSSVIMLFGFTFLYGFSGTTRLYEIAAAIRIGNLPPTVTIVALMLILVGIGFKISAVPFHFWAPDVYEGAPTVVAGFLSTASKAGGFAVLLRFSFAVFPVLSSHSSYLIAAMAVASMLVGNLLALNQKNFKRFLAYSSIAQAGYMLVGVAALSNLGAAGVIYYLMAYLVTNLVTFAIAFISARVSGTDDISGLAGLSQRSPILGFSLLISLLSLGGIPPFAGFIGKVLVFYAGIQSGMAWLVVVAVLNSVLSLSYYLRVLKVAFLDKPREEKTGPAINIPWKIAFTFSVVGIIVLGIYLSPWFGWAVSAASSLALY